MAAPVYTDEVWDRLCESVAAGNSVLAITRDQGMPGHSTVYRWLDEFSKSDKPEIQARWDKYARARAIQAERLAEQALDIADATAPREQGDGLPPLVPSNEALTSAKIRIDTRKWYASKLAPKVYGVPQQAGGNVTIDARTQVVALDAGTLRRILAPDSQDRLADALDEVEGA